MTNNLHNDENPIRILHAKNTMSQTERCTLWRKFLSRVRARPNGPQRTSHDDDRSPFLVDYDRVIFSSAFRRLQDKTQVFPLSESDYTRTRLTHSLEVSSVGRTLARRAFKLLQEQKVDVGVSEIEFTAVVSTACLAHDIGNPPLGHSGETAIGAWAKEKLSSLRNQGLVDEQEQQDLLKFEGNAQGFRVLTRLQMRDRLGGMRPTGAMIGALAKYPRPSQLKGRARNKDIIAEKKFGFFRQDEVLFRHSYEAMGFSSDEAGAYARHPLAFLVEAADDICYGIIDLEDAHKLGVISYEVARDLLNELVKIPLLQLESEQTSRDERVSRLRAGAISKLIDEASRVFQEKLAQIETGTLNKGLIDLCTLFEPYENINRHMRKYGYTDARVLTIEVAGFQTLGGLLEIFSSALLNSSPGGLDKKVRQLFPQDLIRPPGESSSMEFDEVLAPMSTYERLLAVTDYISGMTDTYAVDLYQRLSGIKIGR